MAEIKKTKKEMFAELKKVVKGNVEMEQFLDHEIELLERKKVSGTKTKTQIENENIKNVIVDTLTNLAKFVTISELQTANEELAQYSNQKLSALLKQLVDSKVVNKQIDKKRAYFGM